MDQIAKFASNLRAGSGVFKNPSGTAQATTLAGTVGAIVMAAMTGHFKTAAAGAGGVVGLNLSAKLMTNPNFVKWLATSTKMPASALPSAVGRLAQDARAAGDMDLARAAALLEQEQGGQGDGNPNGGEQ